ncbi:MAG: SCO family protein [bacterium]|nr:SCO family protein [bacterium]
MIALVLAALVAPFHGVFVSPVAGGAAIVRANPITNMLPAGAYRMRLEGSAPFKPGTGVDGLLDRSTTPWTLHEAIPAAPFTPGLPQQGRVESVDVGKPLPSAQLVTQDGAIVDLGRAYRGKTVLLSFAFTRCPDKDVCPAISSKFTQVQRALDPKHFAILEITLDPPYDSPAVLRAYGAQYEQDPRVWTLLTGTGTTIQRVLDEFGINSLQVNDADFIHNDKLFIVEPTGRVAYVIETAGWDPQGVIAEARSVAGMASNPIERFKLSLIASVVALCGGSQFAGVVLLELGLFFIILIAVVAGLWSVASVLWGAKSEGR